MRCAVFHCHNSNDNKAKRFRFYSFPKDPALLKAWILFCKRKDKFNTSTSRICCAHFTPDDFERNLQFEMGFCKQNAYKLKPGAVPNVKKIYSTAAVAAHTRVKRIQSRNKRIVASLLKEYSDIDQNVHMQPTQPDLMDVVTNVENNSLKSNVKIGLLTQHTTSLPKKVPAAIQMVPITGSTTVLEMDFLCRTCLNESNNMKSIFMDDDDTYKMLQSCSGLNIQALDGLPTNICLDCLNKLHISYEFRQLCEISHNTLVNFKNVKMNEELKSEIEKGSRFEAIQTNEQLMKDSEIFKCSLCPNQYTMLAQLEKHYLNNHSDETHETELEDSNSLIINQNADEVAERDNCSGVNEIETEGVGEQYIISSGSDVYIISFKEDGHNNGKIVNGNDMTVSNETAHIETELGSDSKLGEHEMTIYRHTENEEQRKEVHQCNQCDKKFTMHKHLQYHQITHLGKKSYICQICEKRFCRLEHKTRHMLIHSNTKPYKCDECNRYFTRSDNLLRHRKIQHGEPSRNRTPPKTQVF